MTEDAFNKVKKGIKETAEGVKEGVEGTAEGVKEGVEGTAEVVKEGVEGTAEVVKEGVEDTAEGVKETAREATDTDTYRSSHEETKNRDYKDAGGKEPMNPEDIASHEPTAVKRDQDTEIAEEQTGTDSADAKEKS